LILFASKTVNGDEGSIPFARSIQLQQLAQLCRKSAGELVFFQIIFCRKWRPNLRAAKGKIIEVKIARIFYFTSSRKI
jgi:hypothetical protein